MRSFERCPWRPEILRLSVHERLGSASSIRWQWFASTTTTSDSRMRVAHALGRVPEVRHPRERPPGQEEVAVQAAREPEPHGVLGVGGEWRSSRPPCRGTGTWSLSRISSTPGSTSASSGRARAVAAFAKNFQVRELLQALDPDEWSLCSWVTNTASTRSIDSPAPAISAASLRAENPASRSSRAPSVTTRALFPELPLPNMQNRIANWTASKRARRRRKRYSLPRVDPRLICATSDPPCPSSRKTPGWRTCTSRGRCISNAGHRLYNPARSRSWNERKYGPCANANGHGHNYVLEATVRAGRTARPATS